MSDASLLIHSSFDVLRYYKSQLMIYAVIYRPELFYGIIKVR